MATDLMPNRYVAGAVELSEQDSALVARRDRVLGHSYRLQYRKPVHFVRGEGVWLYDRDGKAYLDFYNNVPSLGHSNPEVIEEMHRQARLLNVNTRYLDDTLVDYAEQLVATFPKELDRVVFTCTGSESNDLALRIARYASGGDGIVVSSYAYHGTSAAVASISPNLGAAVPLDANLRTVALPQAEGIHSPQAESVFTERMKTALADLGRRGTGVAAFIFDSIFSSDGVHLDPPGFVRGAVDAVRAAGGVVICDEVQSGFGRTGARMWGFERHGIIPDLVTLGKPMGNGYPIGGVVARDSVMRAFGESARYSNTFAGNTVAIKTAATVLRIIGRDRLQENALHRGEQIRAGVEALRDKTGVIGAIRGAGLFIGIEMGADSDPPERKRALASQVTNNLRDRRVLISTTGANEDTLKIRPMLVTDGTHCNLFLERLEDSIKV